MVGRAVEGGHARAVRRSVGGQGDRLTGAGGVRAAGGDEIAEALEAAGYDVHKNEVIQGEGPIRHTGEFEAVIALHADVQTVVKVIVIGEK